MDSDEDFYYSSGSEDAAVMVAAEEKDYIILKQDKIKQIQQNDISQVCNILSVSRGIACTLLLQENWSLNSVVDKWLAQDDGVRDITTAMEKLKLNEPDSYCNICFFQTAAILSLPCGHPFCADCWKNYLSLFINDGSNCLKLRCPQPKCTAIAGLDMVELVSSDEDKNKYYHYLYRSYIECSKNRKWCPAPGCEYAVEFVVSGCESYDVTCDCSYKFCWNCTEECHRPVDCQTVVNWTKKNKSEIWITTSTKPCPKCQRPIKKGGGCNRMTCNIALCGYQFCWLCLGCMSNYDHRCNGYAKKQEISSNIVMNMRAELAKYLHYYERWVSNNKSRDIALGHMSRARETQIPILAKGQGEDVVLLLQWVVEAWEQIVECRRVLKWTYVYGYYMDADDVKRKRFFEYLQGEAESALERLHHCAEKEILKYVEADRPYNDFLDFKSRLITLTLVTRNCFQNLVTAIENKLCDVDNNYMY